MRQGELDHQKCRTNIVPHGAIEILDAIDIGLGAMKMPALLTSTSSDPKLKLEPDQCPSSENDRNEKSIKGAHMKHLVVVATSRPK
jgi:hypothetical protein